jgi:opacity protein-like surface antigen
MKRILIFICFLLFIPILLVGSGTKGAAFLKIPIGSRPIALGEAYTALGNDVNCIYWNPGGLIYSRQKELLFMRSFWLLGTSYNYLAFSLPSFGYGAFGLGISYLGYGDFDGYDEHYQPLPQFSAYDMSITVTYSQIITSSFSLGGNLKYIMEKIEENSGNAFGFDLGAQYSQPRSPYSLAFSVKNIGTSLKLESEGFSLPLEAVFGIALHLNQLTVPADIGYSTDDGIKLSAGVEYTLAKIMSVRAGYKMGATPGGISGFRAGCGFMIKYLYLDYAFAPYSHLGNSHIVTLGVRI